MDEKKFQELVAKIEALKKGKQFDLSTEEDLSIAVMNLISLEEHFFFTASKTGKPDYLDLLNQTREVRKMLLAKMIDRHEGETWCISKHLLAASMRMIEVGTKLYSDSKQEEAKAMFAQAYKIYSLFWALRLKLIDVSTVKKIDDNQLGNTAKIANTKDQPWKFEDIVTKLVDCCNE